MKDDRSAFPINDETTNEGLTLRDYFAAKAMQSLVIESSWDDDDIRSTVIHSYKIADAMMEARKR